MTLHVFYDEDWYIAESDKLETPLMYAGIAALRTDENLSEEDRLLIALKAKSYDELRVAILGLSQFYNKIKKLGNP